MLQSVLIHAFDLLVGLLALAVCAWVVATGQLLTLDGLLLLAISLTVAAFFAGNTVWAIHTGEMRELLRQLRHRARKSEGEVDSIGKKES